MLSFIAGLLALFSFFTHPPLVHEPAPHVQQTHHASRSAPARPHKTYRATAPASHPGGIAACIRLHESHGNYRAENNTSTASGAYQFLDSTWQSVTGLPGRAMDYPPAVQDRAFYKLWNGGKGANQWVTASLCGY